MFKIINNQTKEIAFVGKTLTQCKNYGIKKKLIRVEQSKNFKHIIWGDWDVHQVKINY